MVNSNNKEMFKKWIEEYKDDPEFIAEGLAVDVIEQTIELLEQNKISQSELASRMGVSRSHISRIFNAPPNLTLLSIARIALAMKVHPKILFNEDGYFIRRFNEPIEFEDFAIDKMMQMRRLSRVDTAGTADICSISSRGGAYATI